jgi:hypothetical protein
MNVTLINARDQFYELRQAWNDIHARDPDATVYQSWAWLCGWIESAPHEWLVVAVQRQGTVQSDPVPHAGTASPPGVDMREPYVAFLAFSRQTQAENGSGYMLLMGGSRSVDHTAFVCLPEVTDEAIPALAVFIRDQVEWNTFELRNVSDPRLDLFLQHLASRRIDIQEVNGTACPYIPLPETWDEYFKGFIGKSTRQNCSNYLNRIKRLEGFHVTEIQRSTADSHIDTLLSLWQARWGLENDNIFGGVKLKMCLESNGQSSAPVLKISACA